MLQTSGVPAAGATIPQSGGIIRKRRYLEILSLARVGWRLIGETLCIAVHLEVAMGLIHGSIANDVGTGVFEGLAYKIAPYAIRRISLPGEKDRRSRRRRHVVGSELGVTV